MSNYSVLMSVYYKEKPEYLKISIESMLNQTVQTDDFVLVCDGPLTPELDAVVNRFQESYSDIFHVVRLDKNAGLGYCAGDEEIYREMVRSFCAQGEKYVSELTKYFSERDWKNYRIIVHSLKSTALVIGANAFSEYAKKMEIAAKEEQETLLLAEEENFLTEYTELLKLLKDVE